MVKKFEEFINENFEIDDTESISWEELGELLQRAKTEKIGGKRFIYYDVEDERRLKRMIDVADGFDSFIWSGAILLGDKEAKNMDKKDAQILIFGVATINDEVRDKVLSVPDEDSVVLFERIDKIKRLDDRDLDAIKKDYQIFKLA